ncbi:hypothetical protein [Dongia sedimenti]|uniref:PH domain-containing protein n=1 Tax=Dongia sedimenti TaxID=3064282 RepID=A0ABU0YHC8_9PROT|nr:hypothetical protein [Rhodospirillaceae bacterium R-7]
MTSDRETVRIIPAKRAAIFHTLFFLVFILMFGQFLFSDVGPVRINGQEVTGDGRGFALLFMSVFFFIPLAYLVWHGRRLLPGSPFDFLEVSPQGLTVGGLLGRRHRRWAEISGFSVGGIPLTNPPTLWIKVESERPLRFFMGGYVRFKLFSRTKTRMRAIAGWLDLVRRTYAFGDGALPPPPEELWGSIIPAPGGETPRKNPPSMIERR